MSDNIEVAVRASDAFCKMFSCSYPTFIRHVPELLENGVIFRRRLSYGRRPVYYTFPSVMRKWAGMGGWDKKDDK